MLLILMRHGLAEDATVPEADFQRPLSRAGREKVARASAGLKTLAPTPDYIASSPKLRARQTAQIARDAWGKTAPAVTEWPELLQDTDFAGLKSKLWALDAPTVFLVGHSPCLEHFLASMFAPGAPAFDAAWKKAGVCAIEVDLEREICSLQWFLPPRVLRALGK